MSLIILGIYSDQELLDQTATSCLTLRGLNSFPRQFSRQFSMAVLPFDIPTSSVRRFWLSHSFTEAWNCLSSWLQTFLWKTWIFLSYSILCIWKDLYFRIWHPLFKSPHPLSPTFLPTLAPRETVLPLAEEEWASTVTTDEPHQFPLCLCHKQNTNVGVSHTHSWKDVQIESLVFYRSVLKAVIQKGLSQWLMIISSVQSLSHVWLFVTPWTAAHQASLSNTISQSLLKLMSTELMMPSNHLILCRPLLLPPSIFPSARVISRESVLCIRWPKYWFQLQHQSFQWIFRTDLL